jgi:hypothetical protein
VAPRTGGAYLGTMRIFNLTKVSPIDGVGDFVHQWQQPTPYRWRILGLSVALTFTMIVLLMPKTERAPPAKPDVIWINTFAPNRSEKEIVASNIANQKRKEAQEAIDAQKEEARKNFYRNLARATGFDPDELAREFGQPNTKPAAKPAPAPATPTK